MSMGGQGTKWRRNIAENFNRLSMVHERHRRQTDGRAMTYSERELKAVSRRLNELTGSLNNAVMDCFSRKFKNMALSVAKMKPIIITIIVLSVNLATQLDQYFFHNPFELDWCVCVCCLLYTSDAADE